jgi:hypothetical protein
MVHSGSGGIGRGILVILRLSHALLVVTIMTSLLALRHKLVPQLLLLLQHQPRGVSFPFFFIIFNILTANIALENFFAM